MLDNHPPRPRLTLNIGITGHRAKLLPDGIINVLGDHVDKVFGELREAAIRLYRDEGALFATAPPQVRLHTPLATGADQVAAKSARKHGYHIRALLPFATEEYSRDFTEGSEREEFLHELQAADEIFALPGERAAAESAYVMVGKAVIATADILVAIWDGGEGNGPGGTSHIVDLALRSNLPVIHIEIDREAGGVGGIRLLVGGDALEPIVLPLSGADPFDALVRDTLAPRTGIEREQLAGYFAEQEKQSNWRLEYPLLLALLRVKSLPRHPWRQSSVDDDIERDRQDAHGAYPPDTYLRLERSYGWANFLAIRYAQLFRSGHIANYVLSALAVIIALSGLIVPKIKVFLIVAELGAIGLLYLNTRAGKEGDWHRRWLQYRHLAESLRPLAYLKQTGMAKPPFRSDCITGPQHREAGADWTRWYAAAIWREMASPTGTMTLPKIRELAENVITEQIMPQAAYHQVNSKRMRELDHRLHEIGNFLMGAVIASCLMFLLGYVFVNEWIKASTNYFILVTAGLPAVGASVFGMRGHGEHLLAASRSSNTVNALNTNVEKLKLANDLEVLAMELDNTAQIMLADLNEWTVAYRERTLEVPG